MSKRDLIAYVLVVLLWTIAVVLIFRSIKDTSQPTQTHTTTEIKAKDSVIHTIETRIVNDKRIVGELHKSINDLKQQLDSVKTIKDTVQIVVYQDRVINGLTDENKQLYGIIHKQDTVNKMLHETNNLRQGVIDEQNETIKKVKKQRNLSLIGNGILTGILIFKK